MLMPMNIKIVEIARNILIVLESICLSSVVLTESSRARFRQRVRDSNSVCRCCKLRSDRRCTASENRLPEGLYWSPWWKGGNPLAFRTTSASPPGCLCFDGWGPPGFVGPSPDGLGFTLRHHMFFPARGAGFGISEETVAWDPSFPWFGG